MSLKDASATGKVLHHKPNVAKKSCQDVWGSCQTLVTGTITTTAIKEHAHLIEFITSDCLMYIAESDIKSLCIYEFMKVV